MILRWLFFIGVCSYQEHSFIGFWYEKTEISSFFSYQLTRFLQDWYEKQMVFMRFSYQKQRFLNKWYEIILRKNCLKNFKTVCFLLFSFFTEYDSKNNEDYNGN